MAIKDYSSTAADNTAISGISIQGTADVKNFDNAMRQQLADIANWTDSDTLASASTTDLGSVEGMYVAITGTTTITSFGTLKAGMVKFLSFSGAGQITHNATSMILPDGVNITRAAGDTGIFVSEGSGNWRCLYFSGAGSVEQQTQAQTNIGAFASQYAQKSADYTVVDADNGGVLLVNANSAARTITLPAVSGRTGFKITIQKSDGSDNTVTIDGNASETINAATTFILRLPNQSVTLFCNGTEWFITNEAVTTQLGSNTDWRWVKHANGKLELWYKGDYGVSAAADTVSSSTVSWPLSFAEDPIALISLRSTSVTSTYTFSSPVRLSGATTGGTLYFIATATQQYRFSIYVVGRWFV